MDSSRKGDNAQDGGCYVPEASGRPRRDFYWWENRFETENTAIVEKRGEKVNWPDVVPRFDISQLVLDRVGSDCGLSKQAVKCRRGLQSSYMEDSFSFCRSAPGLTRPKAQLIRCLSRESSP